MPRGVLSSYQTLVDMAATDPVAWRKLQAVHAMKAKGGSPQIYWSRREGFSVVDASSAAPQDNRPRRTAAEQAI